MARKEKQKKNQKKTAAAAAATVKKISRPAKLKILRSAKLIEITARQAVR